MANALQGLGMAQYEKIRPGLQSTQSRNGFQVDSSDPSIAQFWLFFGGKLGFLGLPYFLGYVVDYGVLKLLVVLSQSSLPDSLHNGVAVLHAVADGAGGGIDQDLVSGHAEVFQQDVKLLGEVDVDGRVCGYNVLIRYGCGAHLFVITLGNRAQHDVQARTGLCNGLENLGVFLIAGNTPDDDGNIDGFCDFLRGFSSLVSGQVLAVGVGSCKPQADYIGLVHIDALLGPFHRVADDIFEGLQCLRGPFLRLYIQDLKGQFRGIGHFPFEGVEIVPGLSAYDDFASRLADLDFSNFSRILYLWQFSHLPPSLTELIYKWGFRMTVSGGILSLLATEPVVGIEISFRRRQVFHYRLGFFANIHIVDILAPLVTVLVRSLRVCGH